VLIIHSSSGIDYEVVLREIQEVVWLSPSTRHGKARQRYLPGFWVSADGSAGFFVYFQWAGKIRFRIVEEIPRLVEKPLSTEHASTRHIRNSR
jgi:hypothetical protein